MRARITALLILLLLIGGPTYLYWYFYKKNISSIIFLSDTDEPYIVILEGKLEYTYFPLLDEVFRYKSTCVKSCIFTPVPPLSYKLQIQTAGREDIIDTIVLETGEEKKYSVILPSVLFTELIASLPTVPPQIDFESFLPIGVSIEGDMIVSRATGEGGEVGYIQKGKFLPLFRTQKSLSNAYLDRSKSYVIVPDVSGKQLIYSIDPSSPGVVFPNLEKIRMVTTENHGWKVQTEKDLYEYQSSLWKKNRRFSDYIDLSPRYRIGYIGNIHREKLLLQNFSEQQSLIVLLDRISNTSVVLKQGTNIVGFLDYMGKQSYLDEAGNIYHIELRGSLAK